MVGETIRTLPHSGKLHTEQEGVEAIRPLFFLWLIVTVGVTNIEQAGRRAQCRRRFKRLFAPPTTGR